MSRGIERDALTTRLRSLNVNAIRPELIAAINALCHLAEVAKVARNERED